jgi:hypothetical protein
MTKMQIEQRLSALERRNAGPLCLEIESTDPDDVQQAIADYRRRWGREPPIVLIGIPQRGYEPG